MKLKRISKIIDVIYIIIQTTYNMSIVSSLFDTVFPVPYGLNLLLITVALHLLRFGGKIKVLGFIKRFPILVIFFIIMGLDIVQNLFLIPGNSFVRLVLLLNAFLFMDYLYQMAKEQAAGKNRLGIITGPYSAYCLYNIAVIVASALLIVLGVLNPLSNPIELQIMGDNIEKGQLYYFPGYLSVVTQDSRFFTDLKLPMLCGLSHEPHVVALLTVPGVVFLLSKIKGLPRFFLLLVSLIAIVLGQSSTAIVCLLFIIVLHLSNVLFHQKKKTEVLLSIVVLVGAIVFLGTFMSPIIDMVSSKLAGEGGSRDYSAAMLSYITHPNFVFGYGNLPPVVGEKASNYNIGIISAFFDVVFFIMLLVYSFRVLQSKRTYARFIGLGVLYFSLHGLKLSYLLFGYPLLVYILFCLCYAMKEAGIGRLKIIKHKLIKKAPAESASLC